MKIENLYTIEKFNVSKEESAIVNGNFIIKIDPLNAVFSGHFPGAPVLPGACTISIIKDCAAKIVGSTVLFSEIIQCKFTGMVDPNIENELEVKISLKEINNSSYSVNGSVSVQGTGRVILKLKGKCSN